MKFAGFLACLAVGLAVLPASASRPVTGNGFGFAVVSPESATITSFYAHPYSFGRPDPANPLAEGEETTNFLKSLSFGSTPAQGASAEYDDDSHVIQVRSSQGQGQVFSPFGLNRDALILNWEPTPGQTAALHVEWRHPVVSNHPVRLFGTEMQLLQFEGTQDRLLLIPLGHSRQPSASPADPLSSSLSWAMIALESDAEVEPAARQFHVWQAGLTPRELAQREVAQLERWRVAPSIHFRSEKERHLWRQSEVMLRMAQSREPNRSGRHSKGLIVACLPDGVFFTPWVRDMAYAIQAFIRLGHRDEARAGLLAYFNAQPTGKMRSQVRGADYQVSVVRYFGDGSEEPFFTMEGAANIEFDNWGEVLWALGEYERQFGDSAILKTPSYRGLVYESARDFVVKPLLANLEAFGSGLIVAQDTSIWEEHQKDQKHFAFSTAAAIVGLRKFAETARRAGDGATRSEVLAKAALLEKGFRAAFIRDGKLHGTLEEGVKNEIDGALLAIINLGVVTDPAIVRETTDRMALLKVASGGYRRVRGTYTDPAIYEYWYEQEEFLFVDFSLAEVYRRQGREAEADAMLAQIVDKAAADHNIIPEMYVSVDCPLFHGAIGDPTGALPMVGYGAGAYILHISEREKLQHHP